MEPAAPFPATDGDTWTGPWPDREWLIPGWLPVGRLGMLSGRGGRGKSRLALQLAARGPFVPAARRPGNDTAVSDANLALDATHTGPVVYASWEDEREEAGPAHCEVRRGRTGDPRRAVRSSSPFGLGGTGRTEGLRFREGGRGAFVRYLPAMAFYRFRVAF